MVSLENFDYMCIMLEISLIGSPRMQEEQVVGDGIFVEVCVDQPLLLYDE